MEAWKKTVRIIVNILFLALIVTGSILIFVYRERLNFNPSYGYLGLFAICLVCNATVLAPAPGILVVMTASVILNPYLAVLVGATGTTCGEMVGYLTGRAGKNLSQMDGQKKHKLVERIRNGKLWLVFLAALLPLPIFDVIGLAAGYFKMKWYKFAIACFFGKLLKMAIYVFFVSRIAEHFNIFL